MCHHLVKILLPTLPFPVWTQTSQNELHQVSIGSKFSQPQGMTAVVHGRKFMHWAHWKGGVTDCNAGWGVEMVGELASSSTFAVKLN